VLRQGVQGISDIITVPGLINVDFADVRTIMCNSGTAMLGVGVSSGANRAENAATAATSAPLIQRSIERATGEQPCCLVCLVLCVTHQCSGCSAGVCCMCSLSTNNSSIDLLVS
jgi:hypothetical protein